MDSPHTAILNMQVAITSYEHACNLIIPAARLNRSSYVCVANVHMCMEVFDSEAFNVMVNNADLVVPDGKPLIWALKGLGEKKATQVRGSDLLLHICKKAEQLHIPIGLYGGTPESLLDFIRFLEKQYPQLLIVFHCSPPFRDLSQKEKDSYIGEINGAGVQILFVGIGCPKQERWMAEHRGKLNCVMIGVGAAFDFFSGRKKHAPRWMQNAGLEWVFRLASDPRRLWKRYLKHNPRFIYYFGRQYFKQQVLGRKYKNR